MGERLILVLVVALASAVVGAEQYYQADPAKLAALEAARCHKFQQEAALIRKRLTSPVNYPGDVARMKNKLQQVEASTVKYCPVPVANVALGASVPVKR
ncbi:MAG: hypothetical protein H6R07_1313 [Proteobacteria bacterium]|nr:hypothetical protein [Pseudomonadota bacterium]